MPPSSRKRNKGKDRKAKQLAKKEENERVRAHEFWWSVCSSSNMKCSHGLQKVILDDHPVSSFMDQFFVNCDMQVIENLKDTLEKHPQIWNDENSRNMAINTFVRVGTNFLLRHYDLHHFNPYYIAKSIIVLEHYNGTGDIVSVLNSRVVASKGRDLNYGTSSIKRDLLKFYRKRTSCKCLKKMHLEARKSSLKMGLCGHCGKEQDRVSLSVCSRCMVEQYCSRECQLAAWSEHKSRECDTLSSALQKEI